MKAPDKIYKNVDEKTGFVCWSETQFVKPYSSTEYIRKDALLEYLNGFDTQSRYERFIIDNVIEKINAL